MSTEDQWPIETWTYAGERYLATGVRHLYYDVHGESMYFAKAPSYAHVGAQYAVEVQRGDEGSVSARIKGARHVGMALDPDARAKWLAEHNAAKAEKAADSLGKKQVKENGEIGDMTLRQVRHMLLTRRGIQQRAALLAVVMAYISP